ncbi:hypothetical protein EJB05_24066, partial [Eragrostis curvula]
MEGGDESSAAFEAALGLNPRNFIDGVLDMVDDIGRDAFQFTRQLSPLHISPSANPGLAFVFWGGYSLPYSQPTGWLTCHFRPRFSREAATPGVLGAARADEKAAELERGLNAIRHAVFDILDKRMASWEKYCLGQIFTLPKGFDLTEDDNSCAKELQNDGTSDSDLLDHELDLLRKNLESANKESENFRREMCLLETEATHKRELDSSIAEIQKLFEEKSVQQNFEGIVLYSKIGEPMCNKYGVREFIAYQPDLSTELLDYSLILEIIEHVSLIYVDYSIPLNLVSSDLEFMPTRAERAELVKAIPVLQQKITSLNKKRTLPGSLEKDLTARTEDIQEIVNILQNK